VILKNSLFTLIIILTSIYSYASKVVIKGSAKSFVGKELIVYTYSDYITNTKEKVGFTSIKPDGEFQFDFEISTIKKVALVIEDKTTWFFTQPGSIYNIRLFFDPQVNKQKVYDKVLSLNFNFPAPSELNQLVAKFNNQYDDFIDTHYNLFMKRDRSIEPKINEFKTKSITEFKGYQLEFINNYITYTIAGMFDAIDVSYNVYKEGKNSHQTKANLYLVYLDKKKVLYHNPEYNTLFKAFFKGEFKKLTTQIRGLPISEAINEKASYQALSTALSEYPFLLEDEFKNLFLLNGLYEISRDRYFKKANILSILKTIEKESVYPQQQLIATNIIKSITKKKIKPGVDAPQFSLKNRKEEMVSLSDFKGKYVYLNFWVNWSTPSLTEMKIMKQLYKKYKGKIAFVSICMDNDIKQMNAFLDKNPEYNWTFLHVGESKKIQEDYNVKTLPTYILIDDQQKIVNLIDR